MNVPTPMSWSARPSVRAYLFRSLLIICAALAVGYSCWPLIKGHAAAQALTVFIILMVVVQACSLSLKSVRACPKEDSYRVSRIAAGHWHVAAASHELDGSLHHAWHGWGWITLCIRPFDGASRPMFVTVWRGHVSDAQWHELRVWTTWEIAMVPASGVRS